MFYISCANFINIGLQTGPLKSVNRAPVKWAPKYKY